MPNGNGTPTLSGEVGVYLLARSVSSLYARDVRQVVAKFEAFVGDGHLSFLRDEHVNAWAAQLRNEQKHPKTIRNRIATVCAVWRDAFERGICDTCPRRVVKVKVPRTIPVAWSLQELAGLLKAADATPYWFERTGIKRSSFWRAFILVEHDTALRLEDVRQLRRTDISRDGSIRVCQSKTGYGHLARLRPETVAAVSALRPWSTPEREDYVFWWPSRHEEFWRQFRSLVVRAGLDNRYGLTRRLRRSSASHLEASHPGAASAHLGHMDPRLAERYYLDPAITQPARPLPPQIGLTG